MVSYRALCTHKNIQIINIKFCNSLGHNKRAVVQNIDLMYFSIYVYLLYSYTFSSRKQSCAKQFFFLGNSALQWLMLEVCPENSSQGEGSIDRPCVVTFKIHPQVDNCYPPGPPGPSSQSCFPASQLLTYMRWFLPSHSTVHLPLLIFIKFLSNQVKHEAAMCSCG